MKRFSAGTLAETVSLAAAVFITAFFTVSCSMDCGQGVSHNLAQKRKALISNVEYELMFDIPASSQEPVKGRATISFDVSRRSDVVLDFRGDGMIFGGDDCEAVTENERIVIPRGRVTENENIVIPRGLMVKNEHIVIPRNRVKKGRNSFELEFIAPDQSLNRRDEFLYTLLVPDRARTLFPCFDQPDMKATYRLTLEVAEDWTAISNSPCKSDSCINGRRQMTFAPTEPLSTYLFSFVAGKFDCDSTLHNGSPIHIYHRETDPEKVAQCRDILKLVCSSLDWMEEYTGIRYPFAKYDCIAISDFQYGGMEHTGATLYNDRRLFLGGHPTTDELMNRASLIAHETAHMWFGDLVTMRWFNDVWTKEVFANWFAARMIRPLFKDIDYHLGDMKSYYASAYSEDRTPGSNAIQRPLDNLNNAGLIYCNIIYDKAPVVMDMLAEKLGEEQFRNGIRRYLEKYSYSNADWDDLVEILSQEMNLDVHEAVSDIQKPNSDVPKASFDVREWSRVWIKEKGMPVVRVKSDGNLLYISESDPFGKGNVWQQTVACRLIGDTVSANVTVDVKENKTFVEVPFEIRHIIPNCDGMSYGCFIVSEEEAGYLESIYAGQKDDCCRMSILMTLYENALRGNIDRSAFVNWASDALFSESNSLVFSSMLGYASIINWKCDGCSGFEEGLRRLASDAGRPTEFRLMAFRRLYGTMKGGEICGEMYDVWDSETGFCGLELGESDYTSMAYQLMIRFPQRFSRIRGRQLERISNVDRRQTFEFVSQACNSDKAARDAFFRYLLTPEGRSVESRAGSALSLLNHTLRDEESVEYILPGLGIIEDVQREGDIFFPQSWCSSLLGGHNDSIVVVKVNEFLASRPDLNPLLKVKILQQL